MHNATTKQRLAALRRKFGSFASTARWVRERRARRIAELDAALAAALPFDDLAATEPDAGALLAATLAAAPVAGTAEPSVTGAGGTAAAGRPPAAASSRGASGASPTSFSASAVATILPRPPGSGVAAEERPGVLRGRGTAVLALALLALAAALLLWLHAPARAPEPVASAPPPSAQAPGAATPVPARPAAAAPVAPAPAAAPALAVVASSAAAPGLEVRPGDTLWDLSARHLGAPQEWPRLHAANRGEVRDPDLIYPGQRLRLPGP